MSEAPVYSLVIGAAEPVGRAGLEQVVERNPHFHCVASMPNALFALEAVERQPVAVVLLVDESPGLRGRDVVADIARASPATRVILTTHNLSGLSQHTNLAAALGDCDFDGVDRSLTALAYWFDDPAERSLNNRTQPDRRQEQDWTKVFAERRRGERRDD